MSETPRTPEAPQLHPPAAPVPRPPNEGHRLGGLGIDAARRLAELGATTRRELEEPASFDDLLAWSEDAIRTPDARLQGAIGEAQDFEPIRAALERAEGAFGTLERLAHDVAAETQAVRVDADLTTGGKARRLEAVREEHTATAEKILAGTFEQAAADLDVAFGKAKAVLLAAAPPAPTPEERAARRHEGLTLVQLAASAAQGEGLLALLDSLQAVAHPALPHVVEVLTLLPGIDGLQLEARIRAIRRDHLGLLDHRLRLGDDARLPPLVRLAVIDRARRTIRQLATQLLEDPFDKGRQALVRERLRKLTA